MKTLYFRSVYVAHAINNIQVVLCSKDKSRLHRTKFLREQIQSDAGWATHVGNLQHVDYVWGAKVISALMLFL